MPVHDWTRVDEGLFHDFHRGWTVSLRRALNGGLLPNDYYALLEQSIVGGNETDDYTGRTDRIAVRHGHGDVVAIIEIVSPGNKSSRAAFRAFVDKSVALLGQRIHFLVVDLFPPTKRDPFGIHRAIWDEIGEDDSELPTAKPLTLVSYDAGPPQVAYVENVAVGDALADMPLFLKSEVYVPAPLEVTYRETWAAFPTALKHLLLPP